MDPILAMVKYQTAVLTGWMNLMTAMAGQYPHLMKLQAEWLSHHPVHRWHNIMMGGADLKDHYGRRAHDVDVEHL